MMDYIYEKTLARCNADYIEHMTGAEIENCGTFKQFLKKIADFTSYDETRGDLRKYMESDSENIWESAWANIDESAALFIQYTDGTSFSIYPALGIEGSFKKKGIAFAILSHGWGYIAYRYNFSDECEQVMEDEREADKMLMAEIEKAQAETVEAKAEPAEQDEPEQATTETETAQVAEPENTYEHAVEIKADKYLDMIQGVEQMGKYRYRYTVAEDFCIDVTICTHDLKDKNDIMHHWKKAGYVSEVSETHLALDCYYTDLEGNCWERYNPTIKKGKLDFEWVLPYTAENVEKLLTEAIKRYVEDSELCIVDLNDKFAHIYSTVKSGEDWFDAVDRAYQSAHENAETCRKWLHKYPENADYWKARVEEYENADYRAMRYTDFQRIQRERILKLPLQEVSADEYEKMLDILPPIHWVEINGVSEFCMMEMYTGTYTNQYAYDKKTGKYYTKLVDVTDRDTWIHKILERK